MFKRNSNPRRQKAKQVSWWRILMALAAALVTGAALLTELRSGPIIAALVSLAVYYVISTDSLGNLVRKALGQKPDISLGEDLTETIDAQSPIVDLLVEAHQHAASIKAGMLAAPENVRPRLDSLARHAYAIIDQVQSSPDKFDRVMRFFTYYLPATADLVKDRATLHNHAGSARLAEIDQTLARLSEAFEAFEAAVVRPDLEAVDLDVELLEQALNEDLGQRS
jgi:hypothetical protein